MIFVARDLTPRIGVEITSDPETLMGAAIQRDVFPIPPRNRRRHGSGSRIRSIRSCHAGGRGSHRLNEGCERKHRI
jgi:hypothetical protein